MNEQNTSDLLLSLLEADERDMSVVVSDPNLPDNPMVFVSEEFEAQTGYTVDEAIGRNCRFLQGPGTHPAAIDLIRAGLRARTRFTVDILNYRRDGTTFLNRLRIRPIFDERGEVLYFIGAQNPID
jgi:PAS domain S-box-containing protein